MTTLHEDEKEIPSVPDALCEALGAALLKAELGRVERQLRAHQAAGTPDASPAVKRWRDYKEQLEAMSPARVDFRHYSHLIPDGEKISILGRHGIKADYSTVGEVMANLPVCQREVEAIKDAAALRDAIDAVKKKLEQSGTRDVCRIPDERLSEFDAPPPAAFEAAAACMNR